MPMCKVAGISLTLGMLLVAASCGGSGDASVALGAAGASQAMAIQSPQRGVGLDLPAPSELAKLMNQGFRKSASYVEADLSQTGASFDPLLPHNRATVNATSVDLAPDWSSSGSTLFDHLAYATYHFVAVGYDRDSRVKYSFSAPPSNAGDVWVGIANWDKNRWDWFRGGVSDAVSPASFAPYFDFSSNMLVVVLRTGTDLSTLSSVRLGALPPVPALTVDVAKGLAPLSVNFDASASAAGEGTITKYEWDYDGDGVYDHDSGTTPTSSTMYSTNGFMHPTVRVRNSFGATAIKSATVTVIGAWQHTWGTANPQQFSDILADSNGDIYAVGYTRDTVLPGSPDFLLLTKFSPNGTTLWSKTWTNGNNYAYGGSIDLDSDGNLIIAGSVDGGSPLDTQGLIQKWAPAGTLIWSESFGGNGFENVEKVMVDGTDIYISAHSSSIHANNDLVTAKLDTNGSVIWARDYDHWDETSVDASLCWSFISGVVSVYVLGEINGGVNTLPLVLNYDPSGNLLNDEEYIAAADVRPKAIRVTLSPFTFEKNIYIAAYTGSPNKLVLISSDAIFGINYQNTWSASTNSTPYKISFDSTNKLVVSGTLGGLSVSNSFGALWQLDPSTGSMLNAQFWNDGDNYVRLTSVMSYEGGLLLAGYSGDATGSWSSTSGTDGTLSNSWAFSGGTDTATTLLMSSEPGPVSPLSGGVMDTGAGANDALIMFKAP